MIHQVLDTGVHSLVKGKMPMGCEFCVRGEKLVLFVTGLCPLKCFYCPVSDHKMYKDVIYANEWKIENFDNILEEAKLTDAKGTGITGGDPLVVIDRVCEYIKKLKNEFGKDFHIHLYTTLQLVTEERLKKLFDAGLDEIRFHPNLDDTKLWHRLSLAKMFSWHCGVEIPCIPGKKKEIMKLIEFAKDKVDFLNLNELELSERKPEEFQCRGFHTRNSLTYAIQGSSELAREVMGEAKCDNLTLYFCTAKLKDAIQMKKRIQRRAKNVKLPFDVETDEGLLIRGVLYLPDLTPGFKYHEILDKTKKEDFLPKLEIVRKGIVKFYKLDNDDIVVDDIKLRLLCDQKFLKKNAGIIKKRFKLNPAIVEEYPTRDALEVDVRFL